MAYKLIFFAEKMWVAKSYSHFFSKNNCELDIVLTRTVHILITNELVKLTMLWTTEPLSLLFFPKHSGVKEKGEYYYEEGSLTCREKWTGD